MQTRPSVQAFPPKMSFSRPAVVLDNGTGFTKMGYAGNFEPNYIIPTLISTAQVQQNVKGTAVTTDMPVRVCVWIYASLSMPLLFTTVLL